jgi:hypothetical protein
VKEEIIRKYIVDFKKINEIKKIYTEVKILFDAGIVTAEISSRYNRLLFNLNTLVDKKIDEIKSITDRLSEAIII